MTAAIEIPLRQCPFFKPLPDAAISGMARQSRALSLSKGELLFAKGDAADGVYLLVTGEVSIEATSATGHSVSFAALHAGALFGELAALDGAERTADARARADAGLIKIGLGVFKAAVGEHPPFAMAVIRDLIGKLRRTDAQIENISFLGLQARLARLLLDLGGDRSAIAVTQSELAEMLSATREKVNGRLQPLQAAGAVRLRRGAIDILDPARLKDFIDD